MTTRQTICIRLGVALATSAWVASAFALHPIQHNWEFRFETGDDRPFSVTGGFLGIEQRANIEGALFIDDDDHGMPILRDMEMRLVDVVSVDVLTGEIVPPPVEPFIREGDLLQDVLLTPLDVYRHGTLMEDLAGIHMEFAGTGRDRYDTPSETRLSMDLVEHDVTLNGFSWNLADDGIEMSIDPTLGLLIPRPACDLDRSGSCDLHDIDRLMNEIAGPNHDILFDLNNDSRVNDSDRDEWLKLAAQEMGLGQAYLVGDSNLDGIVDAEDVNALALNWQRNNHLWSAGNFTQSSVNSTDLNALALNWRKSIRSASTANTLVPEPSTLPVTLFAFAILWIRKFIGRRKR